MSYRSPKREEEAAYRANLTVKKILTVENDRVDNLPTEEKLKVMKEIEEMGDWRGLYEDMYVTFLGDENAEVRRMAASAFWDFPDEKYIEQLIEAALKDPDERVRAECCSALGRYVYEGDVIEDMPAKDYERVRACLLDIVEDTEQDTTIRCRALESLSFASDDDVVELIEQAYQQDNLQWKSSALFAMGRSHWEGFLPVILKALNSESRRLRTVAVCAAKEGYIAEATPRLCELAGETDKETRLLAISALPFTRGEGAVDALEACSMDRDMDVVEAAEQALDDYFGLEEEQLSETDAVDVRLGTTSDIPILDSSRIEEQLMRSEAAAEEEERAKGREEKEEEKEEEEEEEEEEGAGEEGEEEQKPAGKSKKKGVARPGMAADDEGDLDTDDEPGADNL
jgi:HEAT repeat protein